MHTEIKKLTLENLSEINMISESVVKSCFNYYSPKIKKKIIDEDLDWQSRLAAPVFITFGAFVENKLIGVISGLIPMGGIVDIHWVMILKEFQGKGIGRQLIIVVEKWAKSHGAHGIHLFSEEVNVPFYEKLGFEKVGLVKRSYYDHDEYFMNKIFS